MHLWQATVRFISKLGIPLTSKAIPAMPNRNTRSSCHHNTVVHLLTFLT
jgi:hypothetical protein